MIEKSIVFPIKVIFLDFDGVINIPPYQIFDKDCLDNLRKIISATGAKIVVSSSWRTGNIAKTRKHLPPDLAEHVIGETIRGYDYVVSKSTLPIVRGNEIKGFIDRILRYPWHADPDRDEEYKLYKEDGSFRMMRDNKLGVEYNYLILDDDSDMLYDQRNNFVQTDGMLGITQEVVDQSIKILNNGKKDK